MKHHKSRKARKRIFNSLKKTISSGILAGAILVPSSHAAAKSDSGGLTILQRVGRIRSALGQLPASAVPDSVNEEVPGNVPQWANWVNWGNWGNWGNWTNWNNWGNWGNWANTWGNWGNF